MKMDNEMKVENVPGDEAGHLEPQPITAQEQLYANLRNNEPGLRQSAINLRTRFSDNWFSLSQMIKKTNVKNGIDARQLMNMLVLSGMAIHDEKNKELKYKITISVKLRLRNFEEQLAQLDQQRNLIQAQIDELIPQLPAPEAKIEKEAAM